LGVWVFSENQQLRSIAVKIGTKGSVKRLKAEQNMTKTIIKIAKMRAVGLE
jgi:hypothetical protein